MHEAGIESIKREYCFESKKKIGILGGTFNPPHIGHLMLAKGVYEEFALDKILLMPVGTPPHKPFDPVVDRCLRLSMTQLLAEEYPFLEVCRIEIDREGNTYTIDSLHQLLKAYDGHELFYIVGSDTLFELKTWKDIDKVFACTGFICVMREGDEVAKVRAAMADYNERYGARIMLAGFYGPDISSTDIRELLFAGEPVDGLVTDKIKKFMEDNNVYR